MTLAKIEAYVELFKPLIQADPMVFSAPQVVVEVVREIGVRGQAIFTAESTVLRLPMDIVVVGDVHGSLYDLYTVFKRYGMPPTKRYLFLGDLVDRGENSVHVISLVFALKILYPRDVYIIRGNHEFKDMGTRGGFFAEVNVMFPNSDIYEIYTNAFNFMSLGAVIGEKMLCVHGGITPGWISLAQLDAVTRPITGNENSFVTGILWSDPGEDVEDFGPSQRDAGTAYGEAAVSDFLRRTGFSMIIRGHECVTGGYRYNFSEKVLTVFSVSRYCGFIDNEGAACYIDAQGELSFITFATSKEIEEGRAVSPANSGTAPKKFAVRRLSTVPGESSLVKLPGVKKQCTFMNMNGLRCVGAPGLARAGPGLMRVGAPCPVYRASMTPGKLALL